MSHLRLNTCALLLFTLSATALAGCAADMSAPEDNLDGVRDREGLLTGTAHMAGARSLEGPASVTVHLQPRPDVSGPQRVNFAVPLPRGLLTNASNVRVLRAGVDLPIARRALAAYPGGSIRSVQIQLDLEISGPTDVEVRIGEASRGGDLSIVPVSTTVVSSNGAQVPRVWAVLPAAWLSASGVAGPQVTEASVAGTPLAAWNDHCDYEAFEVDSFLEQRSNGAVWLYDRGTTMYRGYARRGEIEPLFSAYRETSIYRLGITGSGSSTDNPVPGKSEILMYFYAQNMAIHYLLTGDDRFRESAEQIAGKVGEIWNPRWNGGRRHWTERNAGFLLLAYVWGAIVSDDRAGEFVALADRTVDAVLDLQNRHQEGHSDEDARCFAHSADAHGEDYGYTGCSPWMSAILADALDAYASERSGARATEAQQSIVQLGRMIAQQGRDGDGRPYYWMGVGNSYNEVDDQDEHWSEAAYVVAMAWHHGGRREQALRTAANELVAGFGRHGESPHMRSFNWQCRSAVATPFYLK